MKTISITISVAVEQLSNSDRGRKAAVLLFRLLSNPSVNCLDSANMEAVYTLVECFCLGSSADAYCVMNALRPLLKGSQ